MIMKNIKKNKNFISNIFLSIFILSIFSPLIIAQEDSKKDVNALGFELEKLLSLINGIVALILFIITINAYKIDGRKRLLYVSIAFLIFSIKGFLVSSELLIPEIEWIDPISIILDLIVLLCFFFGIIKK